MSDVRLKILTEQKRQLKRIARFTLFAAVTYGLGLAVLWIQAGNGQGAHFISEYSKAPHAVSAVNIYGVNVIVRLLSFPEYVRDILGANSTSSAPQPSITLDNRKQYQTIAETVRESAWHVDEYGTRMGEARAWGNLVVGCIVVLDVFDIVLLIFLSYDKHALRDHAPHDSDAARRAREIRVLNGILMCGHVIMIALILVATGLTTNKITRVSGLTSPIVPGRIAEIGREIAYSKCTPMNDGNSCTWTLLPYNVEYLKDFVDMTDAGLRMLNDLGQTFLGFAIAWSVVGGAMLIGMIEVSLICWCGANEDLKSELRARQGADGACLVEGSAPED